LRVKYVFGLAIAIAIAAPLPLHAGPWLIGRHNLQAKLSYFFHSTNEEFILTRRLVGTNTFEPGKKLPYPLNGESISNAYLLELNYGAFSFLDFRLLLSYYDLRYNDDGGDRRDTGPGDLFLQSEFSLLRNPIPAAIRVGVKAPTGEFTIDPQRVPLSENQWDIEGALSIGRSFYPAPVYAKGEIGYRHRFENTETRIKPGNEVFFFAETGITPFPQLLAKIALEGLFGGQRESREFGFTVRNAQGRQLISLAPSVTVFPAKHVSVEAAVKFLLRGRDYPAGVQYLVALGYRRF
jgi:hypothetical protein